MRVACAKPKLPRMRLQYELFCMSRFTVTDLPLLGLKLIERQRLGDNRGFLARLFCAEELATAGWRKPIAQINHTNTAKRGTVRGMHYQPPPYAEMKLVTCIQGSVWDVAVDLRSDSLTFLHWHAEVLSADNNRALLIPEGFAHGFQSLSDDATLLYCHTAAHSPEAEAALNVQDPRLAIQWPQAITELSIKDTQHPLIDERFEGVNL
jgi:dTDP-4-dehydrorhamnose 3,5-epimerase